MDKDEVDVDEDLANSADDDNNDLGSSADDDDDLASCADEGEEAFQNTPHHRSFINILMLRLAKQCYF
jgi:hypothetical protein